MTRGELEACTHEAAVFCHQEAGGIGGEFVAVGWWRGYEGRGATAGDGGEVVVPRAVSIVLTRGKRGLCGKGERRGVGSSSVLKESQTWKASPISGIPEEAYSTSPIRARKEVGKVSREIVHKV